MGKTSNPKPRMAYTLDEETKQFLDTWAENERRSVSNLVEGIILEAVARKKQNSQPTTS
jgi:hypothetical protein